MVTDAGIPYRFDNIPKEKHLEMARKGGLVRSEKKMHSITTTGLMNSKKLTQEQAHFVALLRSNQFATAIRDMIMFIATKAKTADDYHKLLSQIMKLPFIEKVYNDMYKDKQKDVIPIVIDVLIEEGREDLIEKIKRRLDKNGWQYDNQHINSSNDNANTSMPELRLPEELSESQAGSVEDAVDTELLVDDVYDVQREADFQDHKREE